MRLERVVPGDSVLRSIKRRTGIWGEVTEARDSVTSSRHCAGDCWRPAIAREVTGH